MRSMESKAGDCPHRNRRRKIRVGTSQGELTVRIKKRSLTICISDALKEYGAPFSIQGLQFKERSPVQVSGFVRDGVPTSEAPAGFEAPGIDFDLSVIRTDSPMYQNGELITYAGALAPASRGDGTLTGNATENYYFDLSTCQKGSITLVEEKILPTRWKSGMERASMTKTVFSGCQRGACSWQGRTKAAVLISPSFPVR